jgi:hypothetical protein
VSNSQVQRKSSLPERFSTSFASITASRFFPRTIAIAMDEFVATFRAPAYNPPIFSEVRSQAIKQSTSFAPATL